MGCDCLNTMNILLLYLQNARPEERLIVAVILLQLDLMVSSKLSSFSFFLQQTQYSVVKCEQGQFLDRYINA